MRVTFYDYIINSQLLTDTMFILLSMGAECWDISFLRLGVSTGYFQCIYFSLTCIFLNAEPVRLTCVLRFVRGSSLNLLKTNNLLYVYYKYTRRSRWRKFFLHLHHVLVGVLTTPCRLDPTVAVFKTNYLEGGNGLFID